MIRRRLAPFPPWAARSVRADFSEDTRMRLSTRFAGVSALCLLIFSAPAHAGELSVTGVGEVRAVPDQAALSAGVTTTAATAAAALSENATKMTAVFAMLKRLGIPETDIQTSNFNVSPQYSNNDNAPQRIVGYQVGNQVDLTLEDVKKLGPALDALVASGANQINSVGYSIRDAAPFLTRAREAAVADALARAQTYAKAAGMTLGPIASIQEGANDLVRPMYNVVAVTAARRAETPTAAGEQSITASVSIVFEIK
jgi:uncharacterized protein